MCVLVFDSGVGGVGVARELRRLMPQVALAYLMDDSGFPYGGRDEAELAARVLRVVGRAIACVSPEMVVVACNTASTAALAMLRQAHRVPFVGCVPPVRWAAQVSRTRVIGVLATAATARGSYLDDLRRAHAPDCRMVVHGSDTLAALSERRFAGLDVDASEVAAEASRLAEPAIDVVALGCTHYALLLPELRAGLPETVAWLDPAPAVARQAARVAAARPPGARADFDGLLLHTGHRPPSGPGWRAAGFTHTERLIGWCLSLKPVPSRAPTRPTLPLTGD